MFRKYLFFLFFLISCGAEETPEKPRPYEKKNAKLDVAKKSNQDVEIDAEANGNTEENGGKLPAAQKPESSADANETKAPPLSESPVWFNISFTQSQQGCASCAFWFSSSGQQERKPKLEIKYILDNKTGTLTLQEGLKGQQTAFSTTISASSSQHGVKHSIFVQQNPRSDGLFIADIKNYPKEAKLLSAHLYLNLEANVGLQKNDISSSLTFYESMPLLTFRKCYFPV